MDLLASTPHYGKTIYGYTRLHIPKEKNHQSHHRENLRTHFSATLEKRDDHRYGDWYKDVFLDVIQGYPTSNHSGTAFYFGCLNAGRLGIAHSA
jgi:hypothetical protein